MQYLEWNDSIARHFFNEENAGKEILLYVNDEILTEIGKANGCGVDDFIESVRTGPPWASRSGFCQKALEAFRGWRQRGYEYPPYISYLACFVLAAGSAGDFDPRDYYGRLRTLLGETDGTGGLPSFDRMLDLWDDLEKWAVEDKREELGRFVARIRGGQWKVGLPRAQTVISKEEQRRLPIFFEAAALEPSAPPSEQVMLKLMRYYGDMVFERRTRKVLDIEEGVDTILKTSLVDMVLAELEEWDGTVQIDEKGSLRQEDERSAINCGLRTCITYDPLSKKVTCVLRLKANRPYPDNGLTLKCDLFPESTFHCEELYQGWSKSLKNEESKTLDAGALDWARGIRFEDPANKWRAYLKGDRVRLFTSGKADGLAGWVEANRLERGVWFFISASGATADRVRAWGRCSCTSFDEVDVSGLPPGWSFFKGMGASCSCEGVDVLSVSSRVRLLLRGGVKLRKGNTYLYTAPPLVVLENFAEPPTVTANGKVLRNEEADLHCWRLPDDMPPNETVRIEAKTGQCEFTKVLRLEEPHLPGSFDETPWRGTDGAPLAEGSDCTRIRGAVTDRITRDLPSFTMGPQPCVLLGNVPGQVARRPEEPPPCTWEPVWSIVRTGRNKLEVSCCRKSLGSIPRPDLAARAGKEVKKWKEHIWVNRKRTKMPEIPAIREKWLEYREAARRV